MKIGMCGAHGKEGVGPPSSLHGASRSLGAEQHQVKTALKGRHGAQDLAGETVMLWIFYDFLLKFWAPKFGDASQLSSCHSCCFWGLYCLRLMISVIFAVLLVYSLFQWEYTTTTPPPQTYFVPCYIPQHHAGQVAPSVTLHVHGVADSCCELPRLWTRNWSRSSSAALRISDSCEAHPNG